MFRHPFAGVQIVKGSIEPGEDPSEAALRELAEESGITAAEIVRPLGISTSIAEDAEWHFYLMRCPDLPDNWEFYTADGGGHEFAFFWHPLEAVPSPDMDPIFLRALAHVRREAIG